MIGVLNTCTGLSALGATLGEARGSWRKFNLRLCTTCQVF